MCAENRTSVKYEIFKKEISKKKQSRVCSKHIRYLWWLTIKFILGLNVESLLDIL